VEAVSASEAWIASFHWTDTRGGLIHTTDGGVTWTVSSTELPTYPNQIDFVDSMHGWIACDDGVVMRTANGGGTWQRVDVDGDDVEAISFIDAQKGWCVAGTDRGGRIYTSTDGGQSWSEVSEVDGQVRDLEFRDSTRGWMTSGGVRYTIDGGATWTSASTPEGTIRSLAMATLKAGWAVGDGGLILRTTNGGRTWAAAASGTTRDLASVSAGGATDAWAVGEAGCVLHTSNGASWSMQHPGVTDSLVGVSFADASHGFLIGGESRGILATRTGGTPSLVAPVTTSVPGDCWRNKTTTVTLTAKDRRGGSGVRGVWFTAPGQEAVVRGAKASVKIVADRQGHTKDGAWPVTFFSVGKNSGTEAQRSIRVNIDTRPPYISKLTSLKVYRGKKLKVPYCLQDLSPCQGSVKVVIQIRNRNRKVMLTVNGGSKKASSADGYSVANSTSFRCSLARGAYTYTVKATDPAGNVETSGSCWLQVL
jgi:photosystem II stability/assembly factor-like uncharacterized protein